MKREIKFKRVFQHSETGRICMTTWGNIDYKDNFKDDFSSFISPSQINGYYPIADLQYTGLKDRNEKEIYEGDIVRMNYGGIYSVEYVNNLALYSICRPLGQVASYPFVDNDKCEIIGNIYENPELLNREI